MKHFYLCRLHINMCVHQISTSSKNTTNLTPFRLCHMTFAHKQGDPQRIDTAIKEMFTHNFSVVFTFFTNTPQPHSQWSRIHKHDTASQVEMRSHSLRVVHENLEYLFTMCFLLFFIDASPIVYVYICKTWRPYRQNAIHWIHRVEHTCFRT